MRYIAIIVLTLMNVNVHSQKNYYSTTTKKGAILKKTDINIVFDGNSLTRGIPGTGIDQYLMLVVKDSLIANAQSVVYNGYGVSGQNISEMLADVQTQAVLDYDPLKYNIIVSQESTNAILNDNYTGIQCLDSHKLYFSYFNNWDLRILVIEYYPRTPYNWPYWGSRVPEFTIYADSAKTLNNSGYWTDYIDLRDNLYLGGDTGQVQDAGFFDDAIHLVPNGYNLWADEVYKKIKSKFK